MTSPTLLAPRPFDVARAPAGHKTLAAPSPAQSTLPPGAAVVAVAPSYTLTTGDALDFELPPALEAHEPPEARGLARDEVRLLVTEHGGQQVSHARFLDLPDFLAPGDLVVANDSATLPAALDARLENGQTIALNLSGRLSGAVWVVEPRHAPLQRGDVLALPGGATATLLALQEESQRLWLAALDLPLDAIDYLHEHGRPIAYSYVRDSWPLAAYQTVYARDPGSAEMPSAGRAFSERVLAALQRRGIGFTCITLHTGVASLEAHERPYAEPFRVVAAAADAINATRARRGRVIAVGTTVVRALESSLDAEGRVIPSQGWTDLVITPARPVRAVDALLTGFHEPRASHLAMLEAIGGRDHLRRAYDAALMGRYLWHEFGDLHLIL
ncbi:MAG: S-adenosylmethionine:tRNA ribosyltransferase-isomerase-like protein [uncultured Chloroflexi bacterium]|uniref:S-adenosylmethionine:tRNA ribosyltransferase-isomerase-like protein n=1 Tax=uncultured Chloroflexota bacterium TaxID=166587 RepID=A0A6J4I9D5_9CHLR|nr:MAG: S-adenosylmethionine:tRNA ribosyltransferase-isomerase-like protein [uncultured Chloroflexota bacterium]